MKTIKDQDHFEVLRKIDKDTKTSQRKMAGDLGFSLGKLNQIYYIFMLVLGISASLRNKRFSYKNELVEDLKKIYRLEIKLFFDFDCKFL